MTAGSTTRATSGDGPAFERIAAIEERLTHLREHADTITHRARVATQHAQEMRQGPRAACNHAQQVELMQAAIEAVSHELEGLRTAMQTRAVIEQAKGMLMMQGQCAPEVAFQQLVELSQTSHRKLADVAQALVISWTSGHADS